MTAKLKEMNLWLKSMRHVPAKEWWPVLKAKLEGHFRYYGVSGNSQSIRIYKYLTVRLVFK